MYMEQSLWNQMSNQPLLKRVSAEEEVVWINENLEKSVDALKNINISMDDIDDAENRLLRFAPFLEKCFPETAPSKRLDAWTNGQYGKTTTGIVIAEEIGIDKMRQACPAVRVAVQTSPAWLRPCTCQSPSSGTGRCRA